VGGYDERFRWQANDRAASFSRNPSRHRESSGMQSRRQFLATSGVAAGMFLTPTWAADKATTPNDKIGLAFVGLGWRGGQLLEAFSKFKDVKVVALCDAD
jgi:hypothetical protein